MRSRDQAAPVEIDDLGWSLAMVLRDWHQRVERAVGDLPHGPRGYQILAAVVRDEPPTQVALATQLGIDRTVITYLIDALVQAGLVERIQDPADRRARRIVATTTGRDTLKTLQHEVLLTENDLLSHLSEPERLTLRNILRRTAESVYGSAPDTDPCEAVATALTEGTGRQGRSRTPR
ncbi:MarR family transcriptional regulator [Nakamurella silvestris]|nr:MarR family transcriptional regulator [Nakamurella silvestris]